MDDDGSDQDLFDDPLDITVEKHNHDCERDGKENSKNSLEPLFSDSEPESVEDLLKNELVHKGSQNGFHKTSQDNRERVNRDTDGNDGDKENGKDNDNNESEKANDNDNVDIEKSVERILFEKSESEMSLEIEAVETEKQKNKVDGLEDSTKQEPARKKKKKIPLHDMRWGYLSVTDLVSQSWCEQKLVYSYFPPTDDYLMVPLEEISPAVAAGQEIHQDRDLELGDKLVVDAHTKEDRVALQFAQLIECFRSLIFADSGQVLRREIPILGFLPFSLGNHRMEGAIPPRPISARGVAVEMLVSGIIDELRFDPVEGRLTLVELKTRMSPRMPCESQKIGHRLQVMLYRSFYDDLVEGKVTKSKLALHRKLNLAATLSPSVQEALWWTVGDDVFNSGYQSAKITMGQVIDVLLETAKAAPRIDHMVIEYVYQKTKEVIDFETVQLDRVWLVKHSIDAAEFWMGKRTEPRGVDIEDAWKCSMCEFGQDCQWRKSKAQEGNE